jgi:hypothetical protein
MTKQLPSLALAALSGLLTVVFTAILSSAVSSPPQAVNFDRGYSKFVVPFPGTDQSYPTGINDRGQIVGSFHHIQTSWHGFIYDMSRSNGSQRRMFSG